MIKLFKAKLSGESGAYFVLTIFFIIAFGYFFTSGAYLLFFQESQSLFVYSGDYIHKFFLKPGGLLELAGKFLTQFYSNTFLGAVIIAAVLTLPGFIILKLNKKLLPGSIFALSLLLVPSSFLLVMQSQYYHFMEYNLGFILVLLFLLISISTSKKNFRYIELLLFPFFYYLAGAYAWIFLGIYIIFRLSYGEGKDRILAPVAITCIAAISLIVCKKIIFFESWGQLLLFPLPFIDDPTHKLFFHIFVPLIVLYPFLCKSAGRIRVSTLYPGPLSVILSLILVSATVYILSKSFNPQTARVIQLEKLIFEEKWTEAIDLHENSPSNNLIGQYFYNIALSETGQLCNRLFHGRQDFGTGSLILPWGNEYLSWGAYFYYTIGLVNEAHRWAYEEMVVYGFRPQNLKLLVKTNIISANYKMATKYINILKKTIYYKKWAEKYSQFINDPSLLLDDPVMGKKANMLHGDNFFVQLDNPQNNLLLVLASNPENSNAFEYLMAWLLLSKEVETVVNNIRTMQENGYDKIPIHIEEAVLSYYDSKKVMPDLGGLSIRIETQNCLDQYVSAFIAARKNPASGKEIMYQRFGDTFWCYFHFK